MAASLGQLVEYRPTEARKNFTSYLGMIVFLGSWAMMFAALFFSYGMVRARASAWPPAGLPKLPLLLPAFNTLVLAGSSAMLQAALRSLRRARLRGVAPLLGGAAAFGAIFLGLQLQVWLAAANAGLTPDTGTYASVFYGLTWFHALHVLVGLVALVFLTIRAARGAYSAPHHLPVRLWALYWHFVGAVWLLMFVSVYCV